MVVATKQAEESIVERHHPLGLSTGFMSESRGNWPMQVSSALARSAFAVELSTLSERELPPLLDYLAARPRIPFRYMSVHGPSKDRVLEESALVARLQSLANWCDGVVMHPDTIEEPDLYRVLGRKLVIENMDARKAWGRTPDELLPVFDALPDAGFCFDIAHAWSIDPTMVVGGELLDAFGARLRHLHVSSLSEDLHHITLTNEHEALFRPLLERCVDVPWILEAPPRSVV